jgi:hypothetical protein
MKLNLLLIGVLIVSLMLVMLIAPKDGPVKLYFLIATVLVAAMALGLLMSR